MRISTSIAALSTTDKYLEFYFTEVDLFVILGCRCNFTCFMINFSPVVISGVVVVVYLDSLCR